MSVFHVTNQRCIARWTNLKTSPFVNTFVAIFAFQCRNTTTSDFIENSGRRRRRRNKRVPCYNNRSNSLIFRALFNTFWTIANITACVTAACRQIIVNTITETLRMTNFFAIFTRCVRLLRSLTEQVVPTFVSD